MNAYKFIAALLIGVWVISMLYGLHTHTMD